MPNTTKAIQMLNPRELGDLLQLHADTVRKAAKAGAIPSLKVGGAVRFNQSHVAQITRDGFQWPRKTN